MQDAQVPPQTPQPAVRIDAGPTTAAQTILIPQSAQDIVGLRARRAELADQLDRTMDRRSEITREWERAPAAERVMLEQVMTAIDGRIVQLEADIAATERALTNARPELLAVVAQQEAAARAERSAGRSADDLERMGFLFMLVVALPIALAVARRIWRRPPSPRPVSVESAGRLERIEQAVEAMAIEIERVSEGQRFVTKLLSETKAAPALDGARLQPTTHTGREN